MSSTIKVGIIGGTGLEDPQILTEQSEKNVDTLFGKPTSPLTIGKMCGVDVVLLSRHGKAHEIGPSDVNYRANIMALKEEGCTHIITTNACGSLKEEYRIGDLVVLDQFIDRTYKRESSFYSVNAPDGSKFRQVQHIPMGEPFCEQSRNVLTKAISELAFPFHEKGTIVVIEGPRFSTRAESRMFGMWGGDVIGMTTSPEVCLARELGISYASIAMVTDYDSWREGEHVTVEQVLKVIKQNSEKAKKVIMKAIEIMKGMDWSKLVESNTAVAHNATL